MSQVDFEIIDEGSQRRVVARGMHGTVYESGAKCTEVQTLHTRPFLETLIRACGAATVELLQLEDPNTEFGRRAEYALDRYALDLRDQRVLDFGCGTGAPTITLARRGAAEVTAVDISTTALDVLEVRAKEAGLLSVIQAHAIGPTDHLEFVPNAGVDLVTMFEVIEHIPPGERQRILHALWTKLRPGGHLLVTAPNRACLKDGHTTGLWFANQLPPAARAWYARTVSGRCRGWSTERLLTSGLGAFSWWEFKRHLRGFPHVDLAVALPSNSLPPADGRGKQAYVLATRVLHRGLLRVFGPLEAFLPYLYLCIQKTAAQPVGDDIAS